MLGLHWINTLLKVLLRKDFKVFVTFYFVLNLVLPIYAELQL